MDGRELKGVAAISGLGISEMGRVYGHDAQHFAAEAIQRAIEDAGLRKEDVDGLLVNPGVSPLGGMGGVGLQNYAGLTNLRLLSSMNCGGATANVMVQYAAMHVAHGLANHVVCVFADAPLQPNRGGGAAYASMGRTTRPSGMGGLYSAFGVMGINAHYGLATRRHMAMYGTTNGHLGAIAVAERQWAAMNPLAEHREPITIEDYHASRWVAEPLHLLDCCLVSNGGACVIVTTAERARDLAKPPVYVHGMGQAHRFELGRADLEIATRTPAVESGRAAFAMAECTPADVTVCELYDCYTYTVLATFEDYGFCAKGDGGAFVSGGRIAPGGALPTNTGGGELSSFYLWGMTPLSEGVIQGRGEGGARQVPDNRRILVSGNGGLFSHHATLVLSPEAA